MNVSTINEWFAALSIQPIHSIPHRNSDWYPGRMLIGTYTPSDKPSRHVFAYLRRYGNETGSFTCLFFHMTDIATNVVQIEQNSNLWERVTLHPAIEIAAGGHDTKQQVFWRQISYATKLALGLRFMFDGKLTIDASGAQKLRSVHIPVLDSIWASVQRRERISQGTEDLDYNEVSESPEPLPSSKKRPSPSSENIQKRPRVAFDILSLYNSQQASDADHIQTLQTKLTEKEQDYQSLVNDVKGVKKQRGELMDDKAALEDQISERDQALDGERVLRQVLVQRVDNCMDFIARLQQEHRSIVVQVMKKHYLQERLSDGDA